MNSVSGSSRPRTPTASALVTPDGDARHGRRAAGAREPAGARPARARAPAGRRRRDAAAERRADDRALPRRDAGRARTSCRSTTTSPAPEIAYILAGLGARRRSSPTSASPTSRRARRRRGRACRRRRCFAVGTHRRLPAVRRAHRRAADDAARGSRRRPGDELHLGHDRPAEGRAPRRSCRSIPTPSARCSRCSSRMFGITPQDDGVHLVGSPLYHTAVLVFAGCSLHFGHTVVLMDKWTPEDSLAGRSSATASRRATWCRRSSIACWRCPRT